MTYRIIGNTHDFYDYMPQWGVDPHKVWDRQEQQFEVSKSCLPIPDEDNALLSVHRLHLPGDFTETHLFGITGKWFIAYRIRSDHPRPNDYYWFVPGIDEVDKHVIEDSVRVFNRTSRNRYTYEVHIDNTISKLSHQADLVDDDQLFHQFDAPLLHLHVTIFNRKMPLTTNPSFSKLGLVRLAGDPIELWTEITQFLDSINQVDPPQVVDSDTLRDAKGFDDKSFRNTGNRLKS